MGKSIAIGEKIVVLAFEGECVSIDRRIWEQKLQTLASCPDADEVIAVAESSRLYVSEHYNVDEADVYYPIKGVDGINNFDEFLRLNEQKFKADFGIVDENNIVDDEDLEVKI